MTTFEDFAAMIPPEMSYENGAVFVCGRASFGDITRS